MGYRRAVVTDTDALVACRVKQLIDEGQAASGDITQELRSYFQKGLQDGSYIGWVAEDGGRIVATSGVCFYQIPPNFHNPSGRVAYITSIFTLREHRRRGLASVLLEKVLQEAVDQGYTMARLHTVKGGRGLYESFGFRDSEGFMSLQLDRMG